MDGALFMIEAYDFLRQEAAKYPGITAKKCISGPNMILVDNYLQMGIKEIPYYGSDVNALIDDIALAYQAAIRDLYDHGCRYLQIDDTSWTYMIDENFLQKVADYEKNPDTWHYLGDKPAVIDFYASWCGPCRALAPVLDELAAKYGEEIYVYKIDVDSEQELAAVFGIRSIPTLLFIPTEGNPRMVTGMQPKNVLEQQIREILPAR